MNEAHRNSISNPANLISILFEKGRFMMRVEKWLLVLLILLLICGPGLGQDEAELPDDLAHVRLAQFAIDAPELEVFVDGVQFVAPDGTTQVPIGTVSNHVPLPAATYTIALSPLEAGVEGAVVGPEDFTFEAGHTYTLAVFGQYADDDLRLVLLDETEAFPEVANISSRILAHNLKGAPNIDMLADGEVIIADLAYGEMATAEQPVGTIDSILFTVAGDPETVIFEGGLPIWYAGTTYLLALSGNYPGEVGTDYFPLPGIVYMGDITTSEEGTIVLGDEVSGSLTAPGERVAYLLELAEDTIVDILLTAPTDSSLDAYLRLYDVDGNLLVENDELDFEDEPTDAGVMGYNLLAGTYTVEVAAWGDAFPGEYVLSVTEQD
jgi:hypothetical protein